MWVEYKAPKHHGAYLPRRDARTLLREEPGNSHVALHFTEKMRAYNYLAEMWSGSKEGLCLRLIDC